MITLDNGLWAKQDGDIWKMQLTDTMCTDDLKARYGGTTLFATIRRLFWGCVISCSKQTYAKWHKICLQEVQHDEMVRKADRLGKAFASQLITDQFYIDKYGTRLDLCEGQWRAAKWVKKATELLNRYDWSNVQEKEGVLFAKAREIYSKAVGGRDLALSEWCYINGHVFIGERSGGR